MKMENERANELEEIKGTINGAARNIDWMLECGEVSTGGIMGAILCLNMAENRLAKMEKEKS